jgi:hypothetical protein
MDLPLSLEPAAEPVAVCRIPKNLPLNVATVAPNQHWFLDDQGNSSQRRKL